MSFRSKTDLNPNIAVQNQQTTHLDITNKFLPNTSKDGTGIYYSPLLNTDGKLIVILDGGADVQHNTETVTLVNNTSYATGSHQSNSANVTESTGNMTVQGTITGGLVGQHIVIRASHDNNSFFELHNINVNLVEEGANVHFLVNFNCSMKYIQIYYTNDDIINRTLNSVLSFKT